MKRWRAAVRAAAVAGSIASWWHAVASADVRRSGFTVQVAGGVAALDVLARGQAAGGTSVAVVAASLLVGGFVSERVALGAGLAAMGGELHQHGTRIVGPAVQVWLDARLSLSAAMGLGLARFDTGPYVDAPFGAVASALGVSAAAFLRVLGSARHSMQVGLLYAAVVGGARVHAPFGLGVMLGYQYH